MDGLLGPLLIALAVLGAAGAAKTTRPRPTAAALAALPLGLHGPTSVAVARALGVIECSAAAWAIVTISPFALAIVGGLYASFALFVLLSLSGILPAASCGCFGTADSPPTTGHFVFNAVASGLAFIGATQPLSWTSVELGVGGSAILAVVVAVGAVCSVLAMTTLPSVLSLANGTSVPVRTFEIDPHLRSQVNS